MFNGQQVVGKLISLNKYRVRRTKGRLVGVSCISMKEARRS